MNCTSTALIGKKVFNVPNHCAMKIYIARGDWLPNVKEGRNRDM
jgi:hypothetical protein